ncbi:MAG: TetR/AcrR family transcriptional regulator [Psychrobium sp.]
MANKTVTRTDGKLSQQSILEATLVVILESGIRAVKYKTVAEIAGVTQSAVAYYFSGITDLIEQAFRFYFDKYKVEMAYTRQLGQELLSGMDEQKLTTTSGRQQFAIDYAKALMQLLSTNQEELRVYLLLDRIFRNETLINRGLYQILKVQDQYDIDAVTEVFTALKTNNPEVDATHFMALLWYVGEKLLQENYHPQQVTQAHSLIDSMLAQILDL